VRSKNFNGHPHSPQLTGARMAYQLSITRAHDTCTIPRICDWAHTMHVTRESAQRGTKRRTGGRAAQHVSTNEYDDTTAPTRGHDDWTLSG